MNGGWAHAPPVATEAPRLHPLALGIAIVGVLLLVLVVAASSYQRDKLQHMARKMLRSKRASFGKGDGKIRASPSRFPALWGLHKPADRCAGVLRRR
jgi:hypothetical protein